MRIRSVGITGNRYKNEVVNFAKKVISWCKKNNISVCVDPELTISSNSMKSLEGKIKETDLIISLGGDGYLLTLARNLYPCKTPVLPVNLGNLGFNAQAEPKDLFKVLREMINGRVHLQRRSMLYYEVSNKKPKIRAKGVALNDLLVHKTATSRLIHLELTIDGSFLTTYRADGVLVASPTGSTAYNLSASGPILHPEVKGFIVLPICPHTLQSRPVIVPETSKIEIIEKKIKENEEAKISIDGQIHFELRPNDIIKVTKAPHPLILAAPHIETFFHNLRSKLNWGGLIYD